jgi:predicted acyl esterase
LFLRGISLLVAATALLLVFASSASAATFDARGSVEQVYATGLPAGAGISLLDSGDNVVQTRSANDRGGALFRNVSPGSGYKVRLDSTSETSDPLTVLTTQSAPPSTDIYDQTIPTDGYGYMTTRDGTKLAYSVHPPTDVSGALGQELPPNPAGDTLPAPTLIEYSGYGYARPGPEGPQSGIATLANLMGFTVVDVNMRGTGCSGGAFDFFETLQNLDGYDVVETVARQPWVAHNKVGMLGISYGGISQLFTAQTRPPSLAAITPLSVIDQVQTTLYPGGILNTGFAYAWAQERMHEANPADPANPNNGAQSWAVQRVADGDTTCRDNQDLHPEHADLEQKIRDNNHYVPEVADPVSPITFVDKINVPVFMACQWTDEQTGGHCPTLAEHMTGTDKKWFTYTNGTHVDSLSPEIYNRLYDFLNIYVAQQAPPPNQTAFVNATAPLAFQAIFGIDGPCDPSGSGQCAPPAMTLPPDTIQAMPTLGLAQAAFEAQPSIRVLFDNGAGNSGNPGWPYPAFEQSFASFPVPGTTGRSWYLAPDGALADTPASGSRADAFTWDADARPRNDFSGDTGSGDNGLWTPTPPYQWSQDPARHAAAYVTAPLSADTTVVGAGRVDLWVRSSEPDVDLQATISEVRPDGKETFVQNGWVRTLARALDPVKSTELEPVLSLRQEDFAPMPSDHFVPVTVPLYYEGHAYRAGSRIRVRISAPNGDQPIWSFNETEPADTAEVEIGYGDGMPSRLELPVVPGVSVSGQLPPCPGLRGEPCRDYVPFTNSTYVLNGYARPLAASPATIPLVPAFETCTASDSTHAAPLAVPSCNPPVQTSHYLTLGTPDVNGNPPASRGSLQLKVLGESPIDPDNGDQADVQITGSITDVRNQSDLTDYTGELRAVLGLRITDRYNGVALATPGTADDTPLAFNFACSATGTSVGGTCNVATTADAVTADVVREGKRAVWGLGQVQVYDGGADGDADTTGDNTLFEVQGLFAP